MSKFRNYDEPLFNYRWKLSDDYPTKNGLKVFSCFAGGGGSSMGYKLAGYDVIGFNEIDKRQAKVYELNNPEVKYKYIEPIQDFKKRDDLPEDLYNLDILDASFPCSSFSMVGNREKDWGKKKKFREGQIDQILDTLAFETIELVDKLKPKVVLFENVKGLLSQKSSWYVTEIYNQLKEIGYETNHWLLNGADLGLPQRRERVFFISIRKDICEELDDNIELFSKYPHIDMTFNCKHIHFGDIIDENDTSQNLPPKSLNLWHNKVKGDLTLSSASGRVHNKPNSYFSTSFAYVHKTMATQTGHSDCIVLFDVPRYANRKEITLGGSFPQDYNYSKFKSSYIVGMSVPPIMIANVSTRIKEYVFDKLK